MHLVRFGFKPVKKSPNAVIGRCAVNNGVPLNSGKMSERCIRFNLIFPAEANQVLEFWSSTGLISPWLDGAFQYGEGGIGNDQIQIDIDGSAETAARVACTDGAVKGK